MERLTKPPKFDGIRGYLQSIRWLRMKSGVRTKGWRYNGVEDLVLRHGREWRFAQLPPSVKAGVAGECYRNAALLALNHGLIYCEGWAWSIFPMEHAWCVTKRGVVVDPTWTGERFKKMNAKPSYFGVAIKPAYLRDMLLASKMYGLLFRPELRFPILRDHVNAWKHPLNRS